MAVTKSLESLRSDPAIMQLFVLNEQEQVSAYYHRETDVAPEKLQQRLSSLRSKTRQNIWGLNLCIERSILKNGMSLGSILIEQDKRIIIDKITTSAGISFILLLFSLWFCYHLADRFQRIITEPLTNMTSLVQSITSSQNYTDRFNSSRKDELGSLMFFFDKMMDRIQLQTEQLESANKELTNFAYVVSHDLKAPLRAISSLSNWLASDYADKIDEQGQESLTLLVQRAKRMNNLIDGILEYSRVGRIKEELRIMDLGILVNEVIDSLSPPENVSVKIEMKLPTIAIEYVRTYQLFQNLISNAIKHLDKPTGEIKVGCIDEGEFYSFYVADNGPGIEAQYFDKIFQLFQTLKPRDEVENTGVGLTIVKKIVEMYGGRVWVESKIGDGTTFWFTLPHAADKNNATTGKGEEVIG
jgi:signal transduction histidine kinase